MLMCLYLDIYKLYVIPARDASIYPTNLPSIFFGLHFISKSFCCCACVTVTTTAIVCIVLTTGNCFYKNIRNSRKKSAEL